MTMASLNAMRVSKRRWYDLGGFCNSACWRRQVGGAWHYYVNL